MKFLKTAGEILRSGCVIFSIISLAFFTAGAAMAAANTAANSDINVKSLWMFFLFSVLLAAANRILRIDSVHAALRLLIHFAASAAIYFVTVVLFGDYISSGSQVLVAMTLFLVIYLVSAVFILIWMGRRKRKASDRKEYVSQFK